MKECRHCGTENEDSLTLCVECGLDMSPSPARQIIAKLPSAIDKTERSWLRYIVTGLAVLFGIFGIYLLSLGPILRYYGVQPSSGWNRLPSIVRALYGPLDKMPIPEPIARMLRGYNQWWMRANAEKALADWGRRIGQIDQYISVGTQQTNVISMLGQPETWDTNGGHIVASYTFPLPTMDYDIITNGFWITFANGIVVGKTPITIRVGRSRGHKPETP